jgi:hypothetical protein
MDNFIIKKIIEEIGNGGIAIEGLGEHVKRLAKHF